MLLGRSKLSLSGIPCSTSATRMASWTSSLLVNFRHCLRQSIIHYCCFSVSHSPSSCLPFPFLPFPSLPSPCKALDETRRPTLAWRLLSRPNRVEQLTGKLREGGAAAVDSSTRLHRSELVLFVNASSAKSYFARRRVVRFSISGIVWCVNFIWRFVKLVVKLQSENKERLEESVPFTWIQIKIFLSYHFSP